MVQLLIHYSAADTQKNMLPHINHKEKGLYTWDLIILVILRYPHQFVFYIKICSQEYLNYSPNLCGRDVPE